MAASVFSQLERYNEARQEILRAIECKKSCGQAAELWKAFNVLHDLECSVGNAPAAERARAEAITAFLTYRRAGGENQTGGARLTAAVAQAIRNGETTTIASALAVLATRSDLPESGQILIPVLEQILAGSRDPVLASTAGLYYQDAVEVMLLLERLG